jgi:serine/threonine protein kinase
VEGMTLHDWLQLRIKDSNSPPDAELLWSMMYQITEAVVYIHSKGYAHRDIKLDNIIIEKNTNTLKLIDFGFACYKDECYIGPGSSGYAPPETYDDYGINGVACAQAHDVWSLGIVFYLLANLRYPFNRIKEVENRKELLKSNYKPSNKTHPVFIKIIDTIIDQILNTGLRWESRHKPCFVLSTLNLLGKKLNYIDLTEYYNKYCETSID